MGFQKLMFVTNINASQGRLFRRLWQVCLISGLIVLSAERNAGAQDGGGFLNSFGLPGAIEMPDATVLSDGDIALSFSRFAGEPRHSLTFQITPRLTGAFRYSRFGASDVGRPWDRSFSLQYQFLEEGRWLPAAAIGLSDITGTSLYSSEYLVFSKAVRPTVRVTAGLGWGRLGSSNGFTNPLGVIDPRFEVRPIPQVGNGGSFDPSVWFRGDAALFGALQWSPRNDLRLVLEYSSDGYVRQSGLMFDRQSSFNFGIDYRVSERLTASTRYLYGSELGLQLTYLFNPYRRGRLGAGIDRSPPALFTGNPLRSDDPLREATLEAALQQEGVRLRSIIQNGERARAVIENERYRNDAQAIGRTARVLHRLLPDNEKHFDIILMRQGLPLSQISLDRSELAAQEFAPAQPAQNLARLVRPEVPLNTSEFSDPQKLSFGIEPFVRPSFFDPENPLRASGGVRLSGELDMGRGFYLNGAVEAVLLGNLDQSTRPSTSTLPRVRSESNIYDREGELALTELTLAKYFRFGAELYGRITAGYLERMFGGISAELMWKPDGERYAFAVELNRVRQRDFDTGFGFRDYEVTTGQFSTYYEFSDEYRGRLSIGRYLAGDFGATIEVTREFRNGWEVSAFATLTDVPFEQFGEGSFDKGIRLTIPLDWIDGKPTRKSSEVVLRPVWRDGGAQVDVPRRLYEVVKGGSPSELADKWSRFWR